MKLDLTLPVLPVCAPASEWWKRKTLLRIKKNYACKYVYITNTVYVTSGFTALQLSCYLGVKCNASFKFEITEALYSAFKKGY